jgi:hypothetical protein
MAVNSLGRALLREGGVALLRGARQRLYSVEEWRGAVPR